MIEQKIHYLDSLYPKEWKKTLSTNKIDFVPFRNLRHFKFFVSTIKQAEDMKCNISYEVALQNLIAGKSQYEQKEYDSIRNLVRENLHKRGLITEEVYEHFKYAVEGTVVGVDVAKYANGEPDCVMTPNTQYVDFFYELYINISYPYYLQNETINKNMSKLLATIEELERQHIFIKITLVLPIKNITHTKNTTFFSIIPLFSHKERKTIEIMSSVLNDKLLRKFYFAILENKYLSDLSSHYGNAVTLCKSMNLSQTFNEIEFFESIKTEVGA